MQQERRYRGLWLLATITVAFGLFNVVLYFATGEFTVPWFVASLVAYGLLAVGALWLLFADRSRLGVAEAAAVEATQVASAVIYETRTGYLVRSTRTTPQRVTMDYQAYTGGESWPASAVEARLDEVRVAAPEGDVVAEVEAAIARRARSPTPPPPSIHERIQTQEQVIA